MMMMMIISLSMYAQLVDKLSVKAPDGPTKNKILKEIATERNVTWEPESLVEPDPKETVLMVNNYIFISQPKLHQSVSLV